VNIRNPQDRLRSLWGLIDERHNELIAQQLSGARVLDVGCGYGSLVNFLRGRGFEAEGWDADAASVDVARRLFPSAPISLRRIEDALDSETGAYDSIVLKDALHHLVAEADIERAFDRIGRLLRDGGRLVVTDPNPTWALRLARKLARHVDPEAPCELALQLLSTHGFDVREVRYHEVIGLPLSGGYVGIRWVPNWRLLNRAIASGNRRLSDALDRAGLGRGWCWRYLIAADLHRSGARV